MVRKTGKRKEGWNGKKRRDVVAIVLSLTPKMNFTLIQYPNPGAHCYRNCLQGQQRETPSLASDSRQVRLSWAPGPSRFPLVRATGRKENPLTSVLSQISQIASLSLEDSPWQASGKRPQEKEGATDDVSSVCKGSLHKYKGSRPCFVPDSLLRVSNVGVGVVRIRSEGRARNNVFTLEANVPSLFVPSLY